MKYRVIDISNWTDTVQIVTRVYRHVSSRAIDGRLSRFPPYSAVVYNRIRRVESSLADRRSGAKLEESRGR